MQTTLREPKKVATALCPKNVTTLPRYNTG